MKKTFKEIAILWMEEKASFVKRSTLSIYLLNLENHIFAHFGNKYEITESEVQQFVLQKHESGLSANTVRDLVTLMKSIMNYGQRKGWATYAGWSIRFPHSQQKGEIRVFTIAEQKRLMKHLNENFSFRNLGLLICLNTGLRIGEICALKWCDIDTVAGTFHIRRTIERIYITDNGERRTEIVINTPKTQNSQRDIPISRELASILRPLKKIANANFYVVNNSPTPLEPHTYRCYYNSLISSLKLPKLKFHSLRHTFATRCIESGSDYKTVSVLMGHSCVGITMNLYVHPNQEQKQRCIDKMLRKLG